MPIVTCLLRSILERRLFFSTNDFQHRYAIPSHSFSTKRTRQGRQKSTRLSEIKHKVKQHVHLYRFARSSRLFGQRCRLSFDTSYHQGRRTITSPMVRLRSFCRRSGLMRCFVRSADTTGTWTNVSIALMSGSKSVLCADWVISC